MVAETDDLNDSQLKRIAAELGIRRPNSLGPGRLAEQVHKRRDLLADTPIESLVDVLDALGVPVRDRSDADEVARLFYRQSFADSTGLTPEQLRTAARLHQVDFDEQTSAKVLGRRLARSARRRVGFWGRASRRMAHLVLDMFVAEDELTEPSDLPEVPLPKDPDEVLNRKLRVGFKKAIGYAADDYIAGKLDEIEQRIDRKLDEIDRKMDAWRTKEVRHRLRILRITIVAGCLVALLSLAYSILKGFLAE